MKYFTERTTAMCIACTIATVHIGALFFMGHPFICECGQVQWWEGDIFSHENSQQLTDWYTFSHIIHGFLLYALVTFIFPRVPPTRRFLLALGGEVFWEIVENTPWVIDRYRLQALAQGYVGDSIINSVSDCLAMSLGFVMAWRLPVWVVVAVAITAELIVGMVIHDNLTLNVLNFIHEFDFITQWQTSLT